jgi:hypothetical protein
MTAATTTDRVEDVIRRYLSDVGADRELHNARPLAEAIVAKVWPMSTKEAWLRQHYEELMSQRAGQSAAEEAGFDLPYKWDELDDEAMSLLHDIAAHLWSEVAR